MAFSNDFPVVVLTIAVSIYFSWKSCRKGFALWNCAQKGDSLLSSLPTTLSNIAKTPKNWLWHWQRLLSTMNYDPKKLRLLFYICMNVCQLVHLSVCLLIVPYNSLSSFSLFWHNWIVRTVLSLVMNWFYKFCLLIRQKEYRKWNDFVLTKWWNPMSSIFFLLTQLSLQSLCSTMFFLFWWYLCRYISLQKHIYTKSFLIKIKSLYNIFVVLFLFSVMSQTF